jgi:hypothetical protein
MLLTNISATKTPLSMMKGWITLLRDMRAGMSSGPDERFTTRHAVQLPSLRGEKGENQTTVLDIPGRRT